MKRAIICILWLAMAGWFAAAQEVVPYDVKEDLIYSEVHGTGLLMDLYIPKEKKNGLGLIDVVSGAWFSDRGKINDHRQAGLYDVFCSKGYTVFAIRPGSVSKYGGEEMLQHVKRGIRYVKVHAADYGVDPERLGITGASAGAHLATLAVVTAEDGTPDAKNPLDRLSTRVKAAGVFFPPTDFLDWNGGRPNFDRIGYLLFPGGIQGHSEDEINAQSEKLSPARRVSGPTPPFLLIHGDADDMVPLQQSQKMVAAVQAAGGSAELIIKPGGGHPWPTIREEVVRLADWFDKQLLVTHVVAAPAG
ncbi:MAG: prolyl oligopeptidase family serine peptidase [Candidatus Hydrogenedentes bacterium]|nr:prolyl oligopeptidase family serine peptidase [Candidatus Hydrogenedentota bacterium]